MANHEKLAERVLTHQALKSKQWSNHSSPKQEKQEKGKGDHHQPVANVH